MERAADGSKKGFELSVACGVLVPYVKAKLDGIFETLREQEADGVNYRQGCQMAEFIKNVFWLTHQNALTNTVHAFTWQPQIRTGDRR